MSAAANRHGYRGYVSSRGFGGYVIPVPVQSLVLRDYCARKGMLYVLPVNENSFPSSYLVLEGMTSDLAEYDGVLMCSMHMLPQRPERRHKIYAQVIEQDCSLHLVLENLVIASRADIGWVEDLLRFSRMASQAPNLAELP